MPATATRLLTATEAQIRSGRSMVRFRQWVAAARLPFTVDEFGRRRFDAEDVDCLVAEVDRYKLEGLVDDTPEQPSTEVTAPAPQPAESAPANPDPGDQLRVQVSQFLRDSAVRAETQAVLSARGTD